MDYRVLISIEVVEFVERLPRRTERRVRDAIRAIGEDPLGSSEAVDQDETGRRLEIAVVGDYALMYWIDEADRHVKILDIHAADR
jgi:mRNA-degrading endonuclease RelE of RelBE toxin-antitoxin system